MIRLKLDADKLCTPREIDELLPVLIDKMCGDLPDRKDTATLAHVTLSGLRVRVMALRAESWPVVIEYVVSNDAAYALRNELRAALARNAERKPATFPFVDMLDLLEQVSAHIAQVESEDRERKSQFLRRNSVPVREQRRGNRPDPAETGAGR
jgi:hypothetical protein